MRWRTVAVVMGVFLLFSQTVAGFSIAGIPFDGTEPAFLHGIGPQDPRTDNPWAAVFTAVVVAGVILRGLRVDDREG